MAPDNKRDSFWVRLTRTLRRHGREEGTAVEASQPAFQAAGGRCPGCGRARVPEMAVCPFCHFVIQPSLVWVREDGSYTYVCPAERPYVRIGRNPDNDLVLPLDMVSRYHALVWYDPPSGRYFIRDEGSTNGTWVNFTPLFGAAELPLDARIDIAGIAVIFFLNAGRSVPVLPGPGWPGIPPTSDIASSGQTLGRYRILQVIGESYLSRVYKAVPIDPPYAVVALKQPLAPMDAEVRERFWREVEVGQRLQHPNIIRIYDFSSEPVFLVMEYVPESWSLEKMLQREQRVGIYETVHLASQMCDALSYAHGSGVVHRDIKPSNILLAPSNVVKLSDFGIAMARFRPSITITGTKLGTPLYMAPEQARGDRVDFRSDLYSLGVVLYEMLTGRPPFDGGGDVLKVVHQHIYDVPPPPSQFNPQIPEPMEQLVLQLLEKDPDRRLQSAEAVKRALQSCLG